MRQPLIDGFKECNICHEVKSISEYHPNKQCTQGVVGTCRECSKIRLNKWYSDNRSRRQEYSNDKNRSRKRSIVDHFGDQCLDCKKTYPQYVYQFHHTDPTQKDFNPSAAMTMSLKTMWKELDKCVMLCANCHIIRHRGKEGINEASAD